MNEQIKLLAEQAGFQYIKDEGIGWAGNYNASLPKFAELIIGKCIESVKDTKINFCATTHDLDIAKAAIERASRNITSKLYNV